MVWFRAFLLSISLPLASSAWCAYFPSGCPRWFCCKGDSLETRDSLFLFVRQETWNEGRSGNRFPSFPVTLGSFLTVAMQNFFGIFILVLLESQPVCTIALIRGNIAPYKADPPSQSFTIRGMCNPSCLTTALHTARTFVRHVSSSHPGMVDSSSHMCTIIHACRCRVGGRLTIHGTQGGQLASLCFRRRLLLWARRLLFDDATSHADAPRSQQRTPTFRYSYSYSNAKRNSSAFSQRDTCSSDYAITPLLGRETTMW